MRDNGTMSLLSLQDYKDANDIDLVNQGFASLETTYSVDADTVALFQDKPAKAIWATYRFQIMNCCGCETYIDRWKYRFADRAYNLLEKYKLLFAAYEELKGGLGSIDSTGTMTTHGDASTHTNGSSDTVMTNENIPQYANALGDKWLNNRANTDNDVTADGTSTNNVEVTTKSALGMLPAELAGKMKNALFNPYLEYAREFSDLFVPFYASGCDCA